MKCRRKVLRLRLGELITQTLHLSERRLSLNLNSIRKLHRMADGARLRTQGPPHMVRQLPFKATKK